jgi:PAS domain-containing protein
MAQQELEVILLRQLASHLATPILVVDPKGNLVYFNEAAEAILGRRFDETQEIRRAEFNSAFRPTDEYGVPLRPDELPLAMAADRLDPVHRRFWIRGLDGVRRQIEGTAFPLIGQNHRLLGAFAIFWEIPAA